MKKTLLILLVLLTPACLVGEYETNTTTQDTQASVAPDAATQHQREEPRLALASPIKYTEACKDLCGTVTDNECLDNWDTVFDCVQECETDIATCSPQEQLDLRKCVALYSNSCTGGLICTGGQTCQTTFTFGS